VRTAGRHALSFELPRGHRLYVEAARQSPGLFLCSREEERALRDGSAEPSPAARRALLLVRKYLEGARVDALRRLPGTRVLVLESGRGLLVLRLSAPAPALTLAVAGEALATMGEGPPAWPLPEADEGRELLRLDPAAFAAEVDAHGARGWSPARAALAACPGLGPVLARALATGALTFADVQRRAAAPVPTLVTPRAPASCDDALLAGRDAVELWPFAPPAPAGVVTHPPSWLEAAAAALVARARGARFATRRQEAAERVRLRAARLSRLEAHLTDDARGLPLPDALRRRAEALLAAVSAPTPAGGEVRVPDPYDAERTLVIAVDPRLSLPRNADRLFEKARRAERAARRLEERLRETRRALTEARREEEAVGAARNAADLPAPPVAPPGDDPRAGAGPRTYLTTRGLTLLVGRGARDNQQLTFASARPDDWWLHARDVPGAHVVLRDPEGRATDADRREAAEVAAFFSAQAREAQADVHVTRRRNVRPGGAPGRVRVLQSETLRVPPRDPEGRLRRR